ncbi:MAG: serine protease [Sulfuritalea sp.]|nr:serine protease [Sulfuritalea sp.]
MHRIWLLSAPLLWRGAIVTILIPNLFCLPMQRAIAAPGGTLGGAPLSTQAQSIVESVRTSVIQVRTLPLGSDSPFSYGSGFAVGAGNLILTNYHVVSDFIMDPDRYRLEFLRQDGKKGALAVVAIDVVHDLAVVRGETGPMPGLDFDPRVPDKGARGFSIGFPKNQGLTVTEGIVNGLSEDSARGAIHFSGPVNSGMSGGPAVDTAGRVFGVNVASLRSSQLISFVVPAKEAVALVERAQKTKAPTTADLVLDLTRQLQLSATETLGLLSAAALPVQPFGRVQAPADPGKFARCYGTNEKEADKLYRVAQYGCRFKDASYVANGLYLGSWSFSHRHIRAPDLGALRFASLQESLLEPGDDTSPTSRTHKTRWACQDRIVALSGGRAKAVLCLRRYSKFEGLYDVDLKLTTLSDPGEALLSSLTLDGFGYPESMAFVRRFMDAIAWKP